AVRAKQTGQCLTFPGPLEAFQRALGHMEVLGRHPHGRAEGRACMGLTDRTMASEQRRGFAGYSEAHGSALATAFVGLKH
ncbi:MAG: hypothetical protein VCF08_02150, partial [Alphaproteobacteria bacterium]